MATDINAPRTCQKCEKEKAADQFALVGRGRQKVCMDCKGGFIPKGKAGKGKKAKKGKRAKPAHVPHSTLVRAASFGFEASLEVDEVKGSTDIRLKQDGSALGAQELWLNQAEARDLQAWLNKHLGKL